MSAEQGFCCERSPKVCSGTVVSSSHSFIHIYLLLLFKTSYTNTISPRKSGLRLRLLTHCPVFSRPAGFPDPTFSFYLFVICSIVVLLLKDMAKIDVGHLTSLVQARLVLWDKYLDVYKDRNATKSAWREVSNDSVPDF